MCGITAIPIELQVLLCHLTLHPFVSYLFAAEQHLRHIHMIPLRERERGIKLHVLVFGSFVPCCDLLLQILLAGCVNSFVSQE